MALPTSGNISLNQIIAEFEAPQSALLSSFVRGGFHVPDIPENSGVPTSPPIGLTDLYGATNAPSVNITLSNEIITHAVLDPSDAFALYRLKNDGNIEEQSGSTTDIGNWMEPLGADAESNYEARFTVNSGSPSGTFNSWLNLGTSRLISLSRNTIGQNSAQISVQIRRTGTTTVLDSAIITLNAEVLNPV